MTSRSARMICFLASADHLSVSGPPTASITAITTSTWNSPPSARSVAKVCRIGPGSASPLVSIIIRLNCGTVPCARSATRLRSAFCRSERVLQHRQPLTQQRDIVARGAQERIVDADADEFLDDGRGARALRGGEKAAHQLARAGAEEAGDHRHRHARTARALEPAPEPACLAGGKKIEHHPASSLILRRRRSRRLEG